MTFEKNRIEILQQIGHVGDRLYYYSGAKVCEFFTFVKSFYHSWNDEIFEDLLDKMNVRKNLQKKIRELSRGNTLKIALIACLSCKHKYFILDEPTSGLDIITRQELYHIINEYRDNETTVLFSTHMIEDIEMMATHIILLHDGELVLDGNLQNLLLTHHMATPKDLILRYIGELE
jgi:ABC-2 type transport system ATP-binding protein